MKIVFMHTYLPMIKTMYGLLTLHVFVTVINARSTSLDDGYASIGQNNDANLNAGFNLHAFRLDQLNLHNHYRNMHGVAQMRLDPELTQQAQLYAEQLAYIGGELHHCNKPMCDRHGAGENLAKAWGGKSVEVNATKGWYDEIWDYNYCPNRMSKNRPGHERKATGHFTQVVWKSSVLLGIGYARSFDRTEVYVVGRYKAHGNVPGQYETQVTKPQYLRNVFQDNCRGINGGYTKWFNPTKCTQACGGGVRLQKRKCTNPKPSLNGRDCAGAPLRLSSPEWCNIKSCPDTNTHRDRQCLARGYPAKSHNFGKENDCKLHCYHKGNMYLSNGNVDDGTHCRDGEGVCILGKCLPMPKYFAPTPAPPTDSSGAIVGSYTEIPSANVWDNKIFIVPNGAINVIITNHDYNGVEMLVGYKTTTISGYNWGERSWMNGHVKAYGSYTKQYDTAGVTFNYKRLPDYSTITIRGPVKPTEGHSLVIYVEGKKRANISWKYELTE